MRRALNILSAFAVMTAALSTTGCGNSSIEMGPAEIVEAFNKAITGGDFTTAYQLCDTVSMKDYLDSYQEAWNVLTAEDSSTLSIAASILEKAVIEVQEVRKEDEKRIVLYSLEADGHSKTRKATVKKEEGEWRVEEITDAN